MAKTAVEKTATAEVDITDEQQREMITRAISEMKADEFDAEQQMLDIMDAASIDDILESNVLHLKDIIGVPMTITGATLQDSKFENSFLPAYAVIRATFDDGTKALVTTGAAQVVAALVAAQAKGFYPFRCSTVAIPTSSGYDVVKLCKADN